MKLTKKLLPALGMLALSTCMMVTSTFAWFSMNTNVTAKNMIVQAKGDQVYLQIVAGTDAFQDGVAQTTAVAKSASQTTPKLLPVNVVKSITSEGAASTTAYDGGDTYTWVENYLSTTTGNNGEITTAPQGYTTVASDKLSLYALTNTFKMRLDPSAGAENTKNEPLVISSISVAISGADNAEDTTFAKCLSVFVVSTVTTTTTTEGGETQTSTTDEIGVIYANTAGTGTLAKVNNSGSDVIVSQLTNKQVVDVTVYVFYNGDDANCTQEKLAKMQNASYNVTINFSIGANNA